jgi:protein-L-isoaspartate(D-aspartate) O-methyltransferase
MVAMIIGSLFFAVSGPLAAGEDAQFSQARAELVATIADRVQETRSYLGKSKLDPRVMAAMAAVPRHKFVPKNLQSAAYENRPLPIGHQQTISQPSLVAMMTDLMELPADCHVLEVGTGSGYQAAVLAEFCASVHTIEIVAPLGERAAEVLAELGYDNVQVRIGDGFAGWPEHAPYDAVIVTAAATDPPAPLLEQLRPGGRMVIPLGGRWRTQELVVIEKAADGSLSRREVFPVRFVPFTRDED